MRDAEERVSTILAAVARQAPTPAAGALADGARRRGRVRRQRRVLVAVVLLVVAGSAVLWGSRPGAGPVAHDPRPTGGWQTIAQGDARAEVPADWREVRCEGGTSRWAPPGDEPCAGPSLATFLGTDAVTLTVGPGVLVRSDVGTAWTGYVPAGDRALHVTGADRDLVRRVLATARRDGDPVVDGSAWEDTAGRGLRWEQPRGAAVTVCPGGTAVDGLAVTVRAPTPAVTALVRATVRADPSATGGAPCGGDEQVVTYDGVRLTVPGAWSRKDCGAYVQVTPGPECVGPSADSEGVWFLDDATFQPATAEGEVSRAEAGGRSRWSGFVRQGRHAVLVVRDDRDAVAALLDQVR
ncbi:hypothetical protein GUY44_27890 [Pimelobacter simplex]|uniref:Uncharacterized protein n=1 Tax=Nocardioides simplex TaxID=2045 RepID=A0A0A1DGW2_NOCSI|nr:hypothetical protein [Pimelobacter simplex]AIY16509.1 hypothetical protein KR76_06520 [Pimelobacter simplex]MCG8154324.1 hypothetical protein [Pimelobacter simplex]SFN01344.1 hypothetical protein SAMN05421671_4624 [Pimelobacter simplex]